MTAWRRTLVRRTGLVLPDPNVRNVKARQCLRLLQQFAVEIRVPHAVVQQARLPFREGGLGFRHCHALAQATYWSSWVDVLPTLQARFPAVVGAFAPVEQRGVPRQ